MVQSKWKISINRELDKLPPHKRPFAQTTIDKVMQRFYDQKEDHIKAIISIVMDMVKEANIRA
jgi:hypothetical protein